MPPQSPRKKIFLLIFYQAFLLAGLIPSQLKDWDTVKAAVEKYAESLDSVSLVEGEYQRWSQYWSTASDKMKHSTAISALNVCPAMFYPNINSLLRILATLPSTTAEPECTCVQQGH